MGASRAFRLIEGSFVVLFFWESVRLIFGTLMAMTVESIHVGQASLLTVNGHVMLLVALAVPWFAPRNRASLPRTLLLSATFAAILRVIATINVPFVQLVSSVGVVGFCSMYLASLVRANWRTWVTVMTVGLALDMLLRATDSYDPTIRSTLLIQIGDVTYRPPWLAVQVPICLAALASAWRARRFTKLEKYEPASISVWGGVGVGGFLASEFLVLGNANVVSRWTGVAFNSLAPWLIFFGTLPLIPFVRVVLSHLLRMFDSRLRGWVWLLIIILAVVGGNRIGGSFGAAALVLAHFIVVCSLWWIPSILDANELEQVGPSFALGLLVFAALVYLYSLISIDPITFSRLRDFDLLSVLVACGMVGLVRLVWRDDDPWDENPASATGVEPAFTALVAAASILLVISGGDPLRPTPKSTVSVATYNLNYGFDQDNIFQLDLAARTIEASLADIVVLQDVDTGRPIGLGVDQVEYLAHKLRMFQVYESGSGKLTGVAILSRWPIVERSSTVLPASIQSSVAVRVVVRDPTSGRTITVIAAQLTGNSDQTRLNQLYALQSLAGEQSPLAVGIDLGVTPQDTTYQQMLAAGFVDPDVSLGIEQGFTTPAVNPTARHDYVFVRGLVPLASRHVNSPASTHRLVVVEMGFPQ